MLLAVFLPEKRSLEAESMLQSAAGIFISSLTRAEFLVALARLQKLGTLSEYQHDLLAITLEAHIQDGVLELVPVEERHYELAVHLARQARPIVRTLDALHLAMASSLGLPLVTFDTRLAEAARGAGIPSIPS